MLVLQLNSNKQIISKVLFSYNQNNQFLAFREKSPKTQLQPSCAEPSI